MEIIHNISNYHPRKPGILTIGTFDGVHVGHQKIIKKMVSSAKRENLSTLVLTFFPHPRMVLQHDNQLKMIDTIEEKITHLEQLGVDVLIIEPFTLEFSRMTAISYVRDILVNSLNISKLIVGYDHRFGRNREATVEDMKNFGMDYGFEVEEIPVQDISSVAVSSTKIRNAITEGAIKKANQFLGRPVALSGIVVTGDKIGRKIGFPTANLKIEEDYKLNPKNGVYLVACTVDNRRVFGMMNIGNRPTLSGKKAQIETHFFEFSGDLYDKKLSIDILEKIRDEQKFDSLDLLGDQINIDQDRCQKLISKYL